MPLVATAFLFILFSNWFGTLPIGYIFIRNPEGIEVPIFRSANSDLNVTAAISPANAPVLSLLSGGTVTETATGTLTVANLRVSASGAVTLNQVNAVGTLAGAVGTAAAGQIVHGQVRDTAVTVTPAPGTSLFRLSSVARDLIVT